MRTGTSLISGYARAIRGRQRPLNQRAETELKLGWDAKPGTKKLLDVKKPAANTAKKDKKNE